MSYDQKNKIFKILYKRYFRKILRYALRLLRNERSMAEDIAQETFLRAYDNLEKVYRRSEFIKWAYTVTRNLCYNHIRHRRYEAPVPLNKKFNIGDKEKELEEMIPDLKAPTPYKEAEKNELLGMLQEGLDRLSGNYRSAVELCCIDGLSYEAAACALNTNKGVVAHNLMRARRKLSSIINKE